MTSRNEIAALCIGLVALVGGSAATAEERGNPQAGREFAVHKCDACHVVAANQDLRPLVNHGPSFSDIALRPNTTAQSLEAFLSRPHGYSNMPYPNLSPAERANVVAYILTLRPRR